MKKSVILSVLILGLLGAITSLPACAGDILYTTLGPNGEYTANNNDNWVIGGASQGINQAIADPFSLNSGATVSDAVLALVNFNNQAPVTWDTNNNPVIVYIESNNSGSPGSVLATLTQVGTVPYYTSGSAGQLITFECSGSGCTLAAGNYWLTAAEPDYNTVVLWYFGYDNPNGGIAYGSSAFNDNAVGWKVFSSYQNGFEIDGQSGIDTPEPSSFLLLASGLAGLAGLIKRKLMA